MNKSTADNLKMPLWAVCASLAVTIILLGIILWLDINVYSSSDSSWLHFLLFAPAYIFLQIFVEGVLSIFWESRLWVAKLVPIAMLLLFYVAFFKLN